MMMMIVRLITITIISTIVMAVGGTGGSYGRIESFLLSPCIVAITVVIADATETTTTTGTRRLLSNESLRNDNLLLEEEEAVAIISSSQQEQQQPHLRQQRGRRELIPGMVQMSTEVEQGLANVYDKFSSEDIPVYWKIFRNGGSTSLLPYLSDCLNLVVASDVGAGLSASDDVLQVVEQPETERRYVNVDTTTPQGLERAKHLGLVESGLADVIVTPLFHNSVETLFSSSGSGEGTVVAPDTIAEATTPSTPKGRFFTILKHPVERAASVFYYMKEVEQHPDLKEMTLVDYALSDKVESNWMVRHLANKFVDRLLPTDVELAKLIFKKKFFIAGFAQDIQTAFERLRLYFGWDAIDHYRLGVYQRSGECEMQYLAKEHYRQNHVEHPQVYEYSEEWNLLLKANWADVALYEYAQALYDEQTHFFNALQNQ